MKYAIKDCDGELIKLRQDSLLPMIFDSKHKAGLARSIGIHQGWYSPESELVPYREVLPDKEEMK